MQKKIIILLITISLASFVYTQKLMLKKSNLSEKPEYSLINIGNWQYWQRSDGLSATHPDGDVGGIFPKNTAGAIFQDGLLWGGVCSRQ